MHIHAASKADLTGPRRRKANGYRGVQRQPPIDAIFSYDYLGRASGVGLAEECDTRRHSATQFDARSRIALFGDQNTRRLELWFRFCLRVRRNRRQDQQKGSQEKQNGFPYYSFFDIYIHIVFDLFSPSFFRNSRSLSQ